MKEDIKLLGHGYTWKISIFCKVLAGYNSNISESQFRSIIYGAQKAGVLKAINFSEPARGFWNRSEDLENYDFEYHRNDLIDLANENKWKLPKKMQCKKLPPDTIGEKAEQNKQEIWPKNGEIAEMNADKALATMAILLAKAKNKYSLNDRPNASVIAQCVLIEAKNHFGEDEIQFKSFGSRLSKALRLLFKEKSDE